MVTLPKLLVSATDRGLKKKLMLNSLCCPPQDDSRISKNTAPVYQTAVRNHAIANDTQICTEHTYFVWEHTSVDIYGLCLLLLRRRHTHKILLPASLQVSILLYVSQCFSEPLDLVPAPRSTTSPTTSQI